MGEAEGPELRIESLTVRVLVVNFAAIHVGRISSPRILMMLRTFDFAARRLLSYALNLMLVSTRLIDTNYRASLMRSSTLRRILIISNRSVGRLKASSRKRGGRRLHLARCER